MAVPGSGTAPLNSPDHLAEHQRLAPALDVLPRGIVAYTIGTGNAIGLSGTPTILYTLGSVALLAGRLYLFAFSIRAIREDTANSTYFTLVNQNPDHTKLFMDCYDRNVAGALYNHIYWEQTFTPDVSCVCRGIQLQAVGTPNAWIWTDGDGHMRIEDMGVVTTGYVGNT